MLREALDNLKATPSEDHENELENLTSELEDLQRQGANITDYVEYKALQENGDRQKEVLRAIIGVLSDCLVERAQALRVC
jgi:ElaB/YqjD/DUF883 family membrane-anchored ribosome-binding protein